MKEFFRRNLDIIIIVCIVAVLFLLSSTIPYCIEILYFVVAVSMFYMAFRTRKKYKNLENIDDSDDYFDARGYDYEEEIYYIGSGSPKKQNNQKSIRLQSKIATITYIVLGILSIIVGIVTISTYFL